MNEPRTQLLFARALRVEAPITSTDTAFRSYRAFTDLCGNEIIPMFAECEQGFIITITVETPIPPEEPVDEPVG